MFHDPSNFEFTENLQSNTQAIRQEFDGIRHDLELWHEKKLYDKSWSTYRLFEFPDGESIEGHIARCPETASLVQSCFTNHGVAGFSVLGARTNIEPHVGYSGSFLRCHLPLIVPDGDCRLQVGDEVRSWEEGKVIIFDDRVEHSAWNLTDMLRVVLLVDFVP